MWSKLSRYFHTLRHLKLIQFRYQVYYRFMAKFSPFRFKLATDDFKTSNLQLSAAFLVRNKSVLIDDEIVSFQFLNLSRSYPLKEIQWNDNHHGKLWTYNLNYFDFLNQSELSKDQGLLLIRKYIAASPNIKDGFEPYPISLRGINWIKFLIRHEVEDQEIQKHLRGQYDLLLKKLEYHLLGNHLLENAYSLFFAALYLQNDRFLDKSISLLRSELKEQILLDGAHFELSPMYHQILLERLLDCINIGKNSPLCEKEFFSELTVYASSMVSWLKEATFKNGSIPMMNDSAYDVAPTTASLVKYAKGLGLSWGDASFNESGYRKIVNNQFELFMDVGYVGPAYQPGHAHADTFSYVLHYCGNPIIVDPGVSTYEIGDTRSDERSTLFHNTISVERNNSSEVWGGFRVAKRANVSIVKDEPLNVVARHDGFKSRMKIEVQRGWFFSDRSLAIEDALSGADNYDIISSLHFYPGINPTLLESSIHIDGLRIDLEGCLKAEIKNYNFAQGFNRRVIAKKLEMKVQSKSKITFTPC